MRMRNRSRKVLASDKEYEVAEILLYLPVLFSCLTPAVIIASLLSTSSWNDCKRKRSSIDKEKVAVVKNKRPTTRPLSIPFTPSHSNPPSSKKSRCNSVSKIKTRDELLKKFNQLTKCGDSLRREIGKVGEYYNKCLLTNSVLKERRHQQQRKKRCMDPTAQSCRANTGLTMSTYNGFAINRAMDPSSWPHAFEIEGGQVKKCQATEPKEKKMIKIKE